MSRNREKDEAEKAVRRQKAMECGFRLFAEKGIDQVTMSDIAGDSGVGRPSLYRYFSSKVDLVIAIGTWKWEECLREYTQRVSAEQMQSYMQVGEELAAGFHAVYQKAMEDGTLRTDVTEATMFSSVLHIMLAAATRYAAGLI